MYVAFLKKKCCILPLSEVQFNRNVCQRVSSLTVSDKFITIDPSNKHRLYQAHILAESK